MHVVHGFYMTGSSHGCVNWNFLHEVLVYVKVNRPYTLAAALRILNNTTIKLPCEGNRISVA